MSDNNSLKTYKVRLIHKLSVVFDIFIPHLYNRILISPTPHLFQVLYFSSYPFPTSIWFCFILWPIGFSQEHLCNNVLRTIFLNLVWGMQGTIISLLPEIFSSSAGKHRAHKPLPDSGLLTGSVSGRPDAENCCELKIAMEVSCPEDGILPPSLQAFTCFCPPLRHHLVPCLGVFG